MVQFRPQKQLRRVPSTRQLVHHLLALIILLIVFQMAQSTGNDLLEALVG